MYESYFAFKQAPFSIAPDPSFLYPSPHHQKGLEQLLYGIQKEGGFIVLTGEVGTGKTTLCRLLLNQLDDHVIAASFHHSKLNANELLRGIAASLGIDTAPLGSELDITLAIEALLQTHHAAGKKTLLVVEEAQNLSPDALETLRLLTNIETDTSKLIHILLIGQPELVTTLNRPDLRQLNQRVIARHHLCPLTETESEMYVVHRLSVVGGQQTVFKPAAMRQLYECSQGIPRLINLIADKALQLTFEAKQKFVLPDHINAAAHSMQGYSATTTPTSQPHRFRLVTGALVGCCIALLAIVTVLLINTYQTQPSSEPLAQSPSTTTSVATTENTPVAAHASTSTPEPTVPDTNSLASIEQHLLSLWGVNAINTHIDVVGLCNIANRHDLECLSEAALSFKQLQHYNRPAIVTLFNASGLAEPKLVTAITNAYVQLYSRDGGTHSMPEAEFQQRWRGDAQLLWKPAPGFIGTLRLNDKSYQVVNWLQQVLQDLNYVQGKIITGGVYNQVLVDHVRRFQTEHDLGPDGALGVKTLIALNSALQRAPVLTTSP